MKTQEKIVGGWNDAGLVKVLCSTCAPEGRLPFAIGTLHFQEVSGRTIEVLLANGDCSCDSCGECGRYPIEVPND